MSPPWRHPTASKYIYYHESVSFCNYLDFSLNFSCTFTWFLNKKSKFRSNNVNVPLCFAVLWPRSELFKSAKSSLLSFSSVPSHAIMLWIQLTVRVNSSALTCSDFIFSQAAFLSLRILNPALLRLIHRLCLVFFSGCITNSRHGEIKLDYSWKRPDSSHVHCGEKVGQCDWSTLRLLSLHYTVSLTLRGSAGGAEPSWLHSYGPRSFP